MEKRNLRASGLFFAGWTFCAGAMALAAAEKPAGVIGRYLTMPYPEEDRMGEARTARLKALEELKGMPGAPAAVAEALPRVEDPRQRQELVETLRHFPTRENADRVVKLLQDADDGVRGEAIHVLRLFARRVDRIGSERKQRGAEFSPAVERLVPALIAAAGDSSVNNRIAALFALADTLDPSAVQELRRRLEDPSERVRLHAACFLTESLDASGLPEMRKALDRLRKGDRRDVRRYWDAGVLLSSFERITGKSFGPLPMNPSLHSIIKDGQAAEEVYERRIETWAAWWAWEPPQKKS